MRENNIIPKTVRKFKATTNSNHNYPVAPNILNRNFTVENPNKAWACDITYVATGEGWLYLAAVMDLCTDKGVQYASKNYRALLKKYGFIQSMSRKGNCWDNAPMESFFGTLKTELIYHERYQTRAQARASIFDYVESFYNRIRLQEKLGFLSPQDFESLRFSA